MRMFTWGAVCLVLLLLPAVAQAQGIEIQSGQKISMEFNDEAEVHFYRFHAIEGDLVTIQFAVPKKSRLEPVLSLVGPEELYRLPGFERGKMKLSKQEIQATGLHMFVVAAAGTEGEYSFSFKQKHEKLEPESRPAQSKYSLTLLAGAKAKIEIKADRGSDVSPGIDQIVDPAGNDILDKAYLKESKKKAKYTLLDAPVFGRYTVYVTDRTVVRNKLEDIGSVIVKAKISPAKPYAKKLSEKNAFPTLVVGFSEPDGRGGFIYEISAEIVSGAATSATLYFPEGSRFKPAPLTEDDGELRYTGSFEPPDGIYKLVAKLPDGQTVTKVFHLYGGWPAQPKISVRDLHSKQPAITWSSDGGAAMFWLEVHENPPLTKIWNTPYTTVVPGVSTSHLVPDGPLDEATHEVEIHVITPGYKAAGAVYQDI